MAQATVHNINRHPADRPLSRPNLLIRSKIRAVQVSPWMSDGPLAGDADGGLVQPHPGLSTSVVSKSVSKISSQAVYGVACAVADGASTNLAPVLRGSHPLLRALKSGADYLRLI